MDKLKPPRVILVIRAISIYLEDILGVLENLVILVWFGLSVFLMCKIYDPKTPFQIVQTVGADWRYIILIFFPLIYRPLRKLVDEITEFWGVKRKPKKSTTAAESATDEKDYPPKRP